MSDDSLSSLRGGVSGGESSRVAYYVVGVIILVLLAMLVGGAVALSVIPGPLQSAEDPQYTALYEETRPSVVSLYVTTESGKQVQGTGFVYEGGYIVTNAHVVRDAAEVYVQYAEGEWSKANVVGEDTYTDLAVLDPSRRPKYADALPMKTSLPERGTRTAVIGTPNGLRGTITTGVVSGTGRSTRTGTGFVIPDMIQTGSALNQGNSGGPLVNMNGEVIGVVNARQGDNIGFAISSRVTVEVVDTLIENGSYNHSYVGVQIAEVTPAVADANNLDSTTGVMVLTTLNETDANGKLQGVEGTMQVHGNTVPVGGDIIVGVDGHTITDGEDLGSYLIRETRPGDTVSVTVLRDGERKTLDVTLSPRPEIPSTDSGSNESNNESSGG